MGYEHRKISALDRLSGRYSVNEKTGCWIWNGAPDALGYGAISFHKKLMKAHRFSWMVLKGEIPNGLHVLHKCDVRNCINPDHLFLGTHQDNMRDRDVKGRLNHVSGVAHPLAKLNPEKAFEIRWLCAMGKKQRDVGKEYGVSQRTVGRVVNNTLWRMECHD